MSIKSDRWIRRMASEHAMIEPFAENQARAGVISYGVSSYGYDMRVAPEFKISTNALSGVGDAKYNDPVYFVVLTRHDSIMPSYSFTLSRLMASSRFNFYFLTLCVGKSA